MIQLQKDKSLKSYNTFGIDVNCKYYAEFNSVSELQQLIKDYPELINKAEIIGGGSNLLLLADLENLVIHSNMKTIEIISEDEKSCQVRVGSGVVWDDFVAWSVEQQLSGLENLSLIPGEVGATPVQNIGAYGVEVKDVIHQVETINLKTATTRVFTQRECMHGYRNSIFKQVDYRGLYVVTSVVFVLSKEHQFNISYGNLEQELKAYEEITLQNIRDAIIQIRSSKLPDPSIVKNAGSFFKNPVIKSSHFQEIKTIYSSVPHYPTDMEEVKIPAAWLIEQCGWKGRRFGEVGVHEKQALVIVNYGNASGKEIYQLACEIMDSVLDKFGITLEMEVVII